MFCVTMLRKSATSEANKFNIMTGGIEQTHAYISGLLFKLYGVFLDHHENLKIKMHI